MKWFFETFSTFLVFAVLIFSIFLFGYLIGEKIRYSGQSIEPAAFDHAVALKIEVLKETPVPVNSIGVDCEELRVWIGESKRSAVISASVNNDVVGGSRFSVTLFDDPIRDEDFKITRGFGTTLKQAAEDAIHKWNK